MKKYLTVSQMVECEKRSDKNGLSLSQLMDNAALALYREVLNAAHKVSCKKGESVRSIVIIAGKGNNGGDGLVCARHLKDSGFEVSVFLALGKPSTDLSKAAFKKLKGIDILDTLDERATSLIYNADILIDCIFGTGFGGSLRENILPLFSLISISGAFKIACDIPSGCNADTGLCDKLSVKADMTVTFHRPKIGMALSPAREYCGEIRVCDIGIDKQYENSDFCIYEPDISGIKKLLPERPVGAHKGDFGRLLIIAGSDNYYGAAALCTNAALRCGVGIAQLAAPQGVISALAGNMYECTYLPFSEGDSAEILLSAINKASAVLIGCGIGVNDHSMAAVRYVIENAACPVIIDADGLNCLAQDMSILNGHKSEIALTPHIGELARLCGADSKTALDKRLELAKGLSEKYDVTVVSKSAGTLIVSRGRALVTNYGNTALSKGGSGDMLAGMISSFVSQRADVREAAVLGCYLLGAAAEKLSQTLSERGILARDILDFLPRILFDLEA